MTDDQPWCTCGDKRTRLSGYVRINEKNDYGCGRCLKPTRRYYEVVMLPRDRRDGE